MSGLQAIHYAAAAGNPNIVRFLVACGNFDDIF